MKNEGKKSLRWGIYVPHSHAKCLLEALIFGKEHITRGSLAKKNRMFLHSKNKASRKGYNGEC